MGYSHTNKTAALRVTARKKPLQARSAERVGAILEGVLTFSKMRDWRLATRMRLRHALGQHRFVLSVLHDEGCDHHRID